ATLFCGPFLATAGLVVTALVELGDEDAAAQYLPGIVAGDTVAALVWSGSSPGASALTAHRSGDGWTVSGIAAIVVDGCAADLLLVAARSSEGCCLFAVGCDAARMVRAPLIAMDSTRRLASVAFDGCPARLVGTEGGAGYALRRTHDLAALYL